MLSERGELLNINMAPLIDVMLVILVLFLITSPLIPEEPLVEVPAVAAEVIPLEESRAVLIVNKHGRVFFRQRDVTDTLEGALLADATLHEERQLYVRGDAEALFEDVSKVLAAARRVGVSRLNLVVDPHEARRLEQLRAEHAAGGGGPQ
jgi:biopolymer transport protein ExbD